MFCQNCGSESVTCEVIIRLEGTDVKVTDGKVVSGRILSREINVVPGKCRKCGSTHIVEELSCQRCDKPLNVIYNLDKEFLCYGCFTGALKEREDDGIFIF
jgi:hypothetical protein